MFYEKWQNIEKQLSEIRIIYVHTSLETCLERIKKRTGVKNKFDNSSKIFLKRLSSGTLILSRKEGTTLFKLME